MNLLIDDWIPVQHQGVFKQISLKALLTSDEPWQVSLPRDDMEMACLQLLVSLTQMLFTPVDGKELKGRINKPITVNEYNDAVAGKDEWFDMDHLEHPFMQIRGVKATELTDMAKLFAGLTGSTSSTFVNEPNLASKLCPSCAVLGLFNQAMNCPGFGGGFKASLRGSAPISTLILGDNLRETLWKNVLSKAVLDDVMPWHEATRHEKPNWVDRVKPGQKIGSHETGLLRGLFWQPAHIELVSEEGQGCCDCCGQEGTRYLGFKKEKFVYEFSGVWPHPHGPRIYKLTKGEREEKFSSFTTNAPTWTLLNQFLIQEDLEKEGRTPAPVVSQARSLSLNNGMFHLMVGGYRNNQASILERRHELFSIARAWENNDALIARIVETGLAYKTELRKKLYGFFKATGAAIQDQAEHRFYRQSESLVHDMLRNMNFKESKAAFANYHRQLHEAVREIFDQVTDPYRNEPKMIRALAVARRGLEKSLTELN